MSYFKITKNEFEKKCSKCGAKITKDKIREQDEEDYKKRTGKDWPVSEDLIFFSG